MVIEPPIARGMSEVMQESVAAIRASGSSVI